MAKSDKKKALNKGLKRGLVSLLAFGVVTGLVILLNKAGIDISAEEKKQLIDMIVQVFIGGGALSIGSFAVANLTKKRD